MARTASAGVYRAACSRRTTLRGVLREQRIKFCGLTHPADVAECVDAGAWGIGAVLTAHGPRALDVAAGRAVMREVPEGVERVGVFVDPDPAHLARSVEECRLTRVQLHAVADPVALGAYAGVPVTVAVPLDGAGAVARAEAIACDMVLFDAAVAGAHGGTGVRADWTLLATHRPSRPFGLAGGLTPEVVGQAVRIARPFVLDVSSGVEGDVVGRKDPDRVRAFARAARDAAMEVAA